MGARPPPTLRRGGELVVGEAVDSGQQHSGLPGQPVQIAGQMGSRFEHGFLSSLSD